MKWDCPNATHGEHYSLRMDGRCSWCGRKVAAIHPAPDPGRMDVSMLTLYYDYYYNPDFGIEAPRPGPRGGKR